MCYMFENRETCELYTSSDLKTIYRKAVGSIREALPYGVITHGAIYVIESDDPFSAKVATICRFPAMSKMNADVCDTCRLSVRAYNIAKRNHLNNAQEIFEALQRNSFRGPCGSKTRKEFEDYVKECATTPER